MTKTKSADELREEAAALAERQGGVLSRINALESDRRQRETHAQREFDERLTAGYSRRALDQSVDEARRTLEQRLEADPLIIALADYGYALLHRTHGVTEHVAALARLGHNTEHAHVPSAELGRLEDLLMPVVQRLAYTRANAETADLHNRRENAATDTEENR